MLIVFTSIVGTLLAVPGTAAARRAGVRQPRAWASPPPAPPSSTTCSTNASTPQMSRTKRRPLPTGKMSSRAALLFAGVLCVLSMTDPRGAGEHAHRGTHVRLADRLRRRSTPCGSSVRPRRTSSSVVRPAPRRPCWAGPRSRTPSIRTRCCCSSSCSCGRRRISGRWPSRARTNTPRWAFRCCR